ncbi:MAG TPA: hypothetical protein VM032_08635 [Vicinamibacterales bacterium]|nr:hypothetical protein [Vicinamibacterales bacterium]
MIGTLDPTTTPPPSTSTWSGQVAAPLSPIETWDLIWRRQGQSRWLGPAARIDFDRSAHSVLADEAGAWRTARVEKVKAPTQIVFAVEPSALWTIRIETRLTIRVQARDDQATVSVEETGIPTAALAEVERFWRGRLGRIARLARRVAERRDGVRQAVVVIHGIGEQQPGDTLSSLVKSGVLSAEDGDQELWVKPDRFSDSFELREVTLKASRSRPTTDVYEFYWAHVITDTSLTQVASWLQRLLFRWRVPAAIRPLWVLAWIAIVATAAVFTASVAGFPFGEWLTFGSAVAGAAAVLWRFLGQPIAINFIGDAARYLRPKPANIAHRQAIRQAGVLLIEKLHHANRYDRIVVLGHSLGSVIAYDILTHAWIRLHTEHRRPGHASFLEVTAVERAVGTALSVDQIQELQHAAWRRQRANTQPWLITDFVTVGSPLTYADFLIGNDSAAFKRATDDRILPTAPPVTEFEEGSGHRRITFDRPYRDALTGTNLTFKLFHHGAPFAVTRWTNIFFKTRLFGLGGDIIGGPVAGQLGPWVKDVPLDSPGFGFTHTSYWTAVKGSRDHFGALRDALRLDLRRPLLDLLKQIPAFALVEDGEREDGAQPAP